MTCIKATLRGKSFAIPAASLMAVLDGVSPAPVPFAPQGILGLIRYEDEMTAVYDTFGQQQPPARLLLIVNEAQRMIACTADTVEGEISLSEDDVVDLKNEDSAICGELILL